MSRKTKAAEFVDETYNITVTGRNLHVTDAMKAYAIEKVSKVEKFSTRIIDVNITMDVQKLQHRAAIVLKVDHTKIKSEAISEDMYLSIDRAVKKLEAQLSRYHSKIHDHHAKGVPTVDMIVNVLGHDDLYDVNGEIEEETHQLLIEKYGPRSVVRQEKMPLKTLTQDEAIMKMDLSGDAFMLYRGEEDRKLKVIFRREEDGQYAIVQPES